MITKPKAVIANDFIQGNLPITEVEYKTFMLLVSCIRFKEKLSAEKWYSFSIETYMELAGVPRKAAYGAIRLAASKLLDRKCIIKEETATITCHLVSEVRVNAETSEVSARFSPSLFPYLSELRSKFTYIDLRESFLIRNPQICGLYNLLLMHRWNKRQKSIIISLPELYDVLDVPKSYRNYKEANKHILSKGAKEFKRLGLCGLKVKPIKQGRSTTSVELLVDWEEDVQARQLEIYTKNILKGFKGKGVLGFTMKIGEKNE